MRLLPITNQIIFKNNDEFLRKLRSRYIFDAKNKCYALKEFVEHPDLKDTSNKAQKVIESLMNRACQIVDISCIDAIATLKMIKDKHPHLEKLAEECIDLLEYYNACKIW